VELNIKKGSIYTRVESDEYNYVFNRKTGKFARWGKTFNDDPQFAPMPEIADIEISTICHNGCSFCYKSNTTNGAYMSISKFRTIVDKMPWLTQIAFGIGDIDSNPDLKDILEYTRSKGIIPNITINGARMTDYYYDMLVTLCGAVSVSRYKDKDVCYDAVYELTRRGLEQVNIHQLVSFETQMDCYNTMDAYNTDPRLLKLNAIVLLALKEKGERNTYKPLTQIDFTKLVQHGIDSKVPLGFDSCSCHKFLEAVKDSPKFEQYKMLSEPCESTLFSVYINVEGKMYPCSFCEEVFPGIDVVECKDFINDVWNGEVTKDFRKILLKEERECPVYEV
jgi:MoaA/NifB/PqqE/SkfB family radical SAM enzyme